MNVGRFQQLIGKNCDGGHYTCSPPKECCKQGCCYLLAPSLYRPPAGPPSTLLNPLFLGHWYFWLAVTLTVAGILCVCSLWRRHGQGGRCCFGAGREERASERDSNGSCYAPPQYSRCNSFYQAPPPYAEVTSKPDMYPLVIGYSRDAPVKANNSTGYLMVQYFRNFIVRPAGGGGGSSLSATSTIDSLSSSFICNATNEANMIIPPPYSCMGSLEEVSVDGETGEGSNNGTSLPRSTSGASSVYHQVLHTSPSVHSSVNNATNVSSTITPIHSRGGAAAGIVSNGTVVSIRNNPCFGQNTTNILVTRNSNHCAEPTMAPIADDNTNIVNVECKSQINCDASPYKTNATTVNVNNNNNNMYKVNKMLTINKLPKECSQDSESQDDENNFADLLNLSICMPNNNNNSVGNLVMPIQSMNNNNFSIANSMTGSDISSLANLGTPDSPPRATTPTVELREILDKIQQLPQSNRSPIVSTSPSIAAIVENRMSKGCFHRAKAKTMYMPLYDGTSNKMKTYNPSKMFAKSWLSRSAPNTPCTNTTPSFPTHKLNSTMSSSSSQRNSKTQITDESPLLHNHQEDDEENNKDECL